MSCGGFRHGSFTVHSITQGRHLEHWRGGTILIYCVAITVGILELEIFSMCTVILELYVILSQLDLVYNYIFCEDTWVLIYKSPL